MIKRPLAWPVFGFDFKACFLEEFGEVVGDVLSHLAIIWNMLEKP